MRHRCEIIQAVVVENIDRSLDVKPSTFDDMIGDAWHVTSTEHFETYTTFKNVTHPFFDMQMTSRFQWRI